MEDVLYPCAGTFLQLLLNGGLICVFGFSRNMQMNLMIRITGSFLSLISFAMSVISEASIS